jgi:hypothetical protein
MTLQKSRTRDLRWPPTPDEESTKKATVAWRNASPSWALPRCVSCTVWWANGINTSGTLVKSSGHIGDVQSSQAGPVSPLCCTSAIPMPYQLVPSCLILSSSAIFLPQFWRDKRIRRRFIQGKFTAEAIRRGVTAQDADCINEYDEENSS